MPDHDFSESHAKLFRSHTRAIAHMRQQIAAKRLCLIFGAGAGCDLDFPEWSEFLIQLGSGLDGFSDAEKSAAKNEVVLAQLLVKLFEYDFDKKHPRPSLDNVVLQKKHQASLNAEWRDRIYGALYKNVEISDEDRFIRRSCYYKSFLDVIKQSPITITYNFDDSIERFLAADRTTGEKTKKRGYTTVHDDNSQLPALTPIIYHPNGFLAHVAAEKPSRELILSEESFSEQLTDSIAGRHAVLHSELSQKTCLFIGCSLSDPTLSYFLRRNATHYPGHFHYYVFWTGKDGERKCPPAYADRLFEVFNLITLCLSTDEILKMGDLLSFANDFLLDNAGEHGIDPMFTYIVTGAVGAGKSSVISHFRSLRQHDEWLEPRKPGMERDVGALSIEAVRVIDDWVDKQFALKNRALHDKQNAIGVHILDRGPLDPLAFIKHGTLSQRARKLMLAICKPKLQKEIVPAHIVLLTSDPVEMEIRATSRGKKFPAAVLEKQESDLRFVYGPAPGVTVIDTRGLTTEEIVRRIARVIHRNEYTERILTKRLEWLQDHDDQLDLGLDTNQVTAS